MPGVAGLCPDRFLDMDGFGRGGGALVAVDDAKDFFAHGDEVGTGFDATSIASLQVAPVEVRREAANPGRAPLPRCG
ncbi:hypothetical protein G6F57_023373 [Rhizopus arrhizus]|nr:hypothetical protein G6F57_023373 [Rhizopus arrhizus]